MEKNLEKDIYYVLLFSCQVASDLFVTPWTVARQDPLFMGFPGKNTGVGCYFLLQGIFPTQGSSKPGYWALEDRFFTTEPPGKPMYIYK